MIATLISRVVAPVLRCSRDESSGTPRCQAQWGRLRKTALIGGVIYRQSTSFKVSGLSLFSPLWGPSCLVATNRPLPKNLPHLPISLESHNRTHTSKIQCLSHTHKATYCRTVLHLDMLLTPLALCRARESKR